MPLRVLFLCMGNSARSILFAATLNHVGDGRFQAYTAGNQPAGRVDPHAHRQCQQTLVIDRAGTRTLCLLPLLTVLTVFP